MIKKILNVIGFWGPWDNKTNIVWGFINSALAILNALCNTNINWIIVILNSYAAFLCFYSAYNQHKNKPVDAE